MYRIFQKNYAGKNYIFLLNLLKIIFHNLFLVKIYKFL